MHHLISRLVCLSWILSVVLPSAGAEVKSIRLRLMAEGFVSPTAIVSVDAKSGAMAVADQAGVVRVMEKDGSLRDDVLLDLTDRMVKLNPGFDERGLLSVAVHPKFSSNRKFYVTYSAPRRASMPTNWDSTVRLSEFKVKAGDTLVADPASERVLLEIDKPYFNHNGGCLAFGPDGFLYMSVGDGGNGNGQGVGHSPISNGQDLNTLLGKVLRLDVDHGKPYDIPRDNPYASGGGKPEIFAYGFRNPWRMTFDRGGKHELFVGDIGQTLFEEVDMVVKGGNYGWFIREGRHCFNPADAKVALQTCATQGADGKPLVDPILEYKNPNGFRNDPEAVGISVMGGYVYRGKALPALQGQYVFGDWSKNWAVADGVLILATPPSTSGDNWSWKVVPSALEDGGKWKVYITGFGEDAEGELYVFTNNSNSVVGKTGKIFKLVGVE